MDEEDFIELIELVSQHLSEIGASEIADATLYLRRDGTTGESFSDDPRQQLVEMLRAFERHLKIRDCVTYHLALGSINRSLQVGSIETAEVSPIQGDLRDTPVLLAEAPDYSEILEKLQILIGHLLESYRPRGLER